MRNLFFITCALVMVIHLAACSTLQNVGRKACENFHTVSATLHAAYAKADEIGDPIVRASTKAAIVATLDAMNTCPPTVQSVG